MTEIQRDSAESGLLLDWPDPVEVEVDPPQKWGERDMLNLLNRRYDVRVGNGQRYAQAEHVRSHAGFDARRTADFVAMDLWPSKGLALHGHEVKVSRSDWLAELKDPTKADEFKRYMDRWWLVVPDAGIVRDDLPVGWGLMAVRDGRLRVIKPAPKLDPEPMPKTMMAALLRAVAVTATRVTPPGVTDSTENTGTVTP